MSPLQRPVTVPISPTTANTTPTPTTTLTSHNDHHQRSTPKAPNPNHIIIKAPSNPQNQNKNTHYIDIPYPIPRPLTQPNHTMATPTPSSPATTIANTATDDAVPPTKKPQPIPWTHQETVNLIRAYQEKWYAVKRGPLRSSQWEEVAVVVAARCGYDFSHPSKSAVQCRHKMEKLRQRHRAEKRQRLLAATATRATWQYTGLMDELERGPMPISARPIASLAPSSDNYDDQYDNCDENDEEDEETEINYKKSRSINYILRESQRPSVNKYRGVLRREDVDVVDDVDHGDVDDEKGVVVLDERVLVSGLSSEIRGFAERLIGMENLKMEMMKETERCRLEMENRRIEMILESRRRTIDSIGRAFGSSKRMKMTDE